MFLTTFVLLILETSFTVNPQLCNIEYILSVSSFEWVSIITCRIVLYFLNILRHCKQIT